MNSSSEPDGGETTDLDSDIRLAAFAALGELTAPTGGIVTREQMTAGFIFRGVRIPFANRAVGIWTPRQLSDASGAALSITTSARKTGVTPRYDDDVRSDGWFGYRYQGTDPDNHFNRSLRRAGDRKLPLIYFYGLAPGVYEALFPVYIMEDHPGDLTVLVAPDAHGIGESTLFHGGSAPILKEYVTRVVKQRLHQHRFRELVLTAYQRRCTVCSLGSEDRLVPLLDAAHILPDHDVRGLPEIPNGLSLCKIHHSAYDLNILGVSPDFQVHIRRDVLKTVDGPMLEHGIKEMAGRVIKVPQAAAQRPNAEYLAERFERFRAA